MKKTIIIPASFVLSVSSIFALPSYEPFVNATGSGGTAYSTTYSAYPSPNQLGGQINAFGEGWITDNGGTGFWVSVTNVALTYPGTLPTGFPAIPAQCALITATGANGIGACLQFNKTIYPPPGQASLAGAATTNSIYASFFMNVPHANPASGGSTPNSEVFWGGFVGPNLTNATALTGGSRPTDHCTRFEFIGSGSPQGTTYELGVATCNNNAGTIYGTTTAATNTTYFVVMDYEFGGTNTGGTVTNDWYRVWINPSSSTFGAATAPAANVSANYSAQSAYVMTNVAGFYLWDRNAATMPGSGILMSALRIGTTWSFATGGPEFSAPPTNTAANYSSNVVLTGTAVAGGLPITSYQWYNGTTALTDGGNISGSSTANLTLSSVAYGNDGTYSVVATDAIGYISNSAVLTVNDPFISTPPVSQSLTNGAKAVFTVAAAGSPTLSYQWQINGVNLTDGNNDPSGSGAIISGSSTTSLTLNPVGFADNGEGLQCLVTGPNASVRSTAAILTVADPLILSEPQSVTSSNGLGATFTVSASGGSTLHYQWQFNGQNLSDGASVSGSGATVSGSLTSSMSLSGVHYQDAGGYAVVVSDASATSPANSTPATLTVIDPYVMTQPGNQSPKAGNNAIFTVVASGSPTVSYQWQKGGNNLGDGLTGSGSTISGSTTASLTIASVSDADDATNYEVLLTGGSSGQQITSSNATLFTQDSIVLQAPLQNRIDRVGDDVSFGVSITGTTPAYQWSSNGVPISGATGSSLTLNNIQTSYAATYSVSITNPVTLTPVTSSGTLTVVPQVNYSITNLVVARIGDGAQALNTNAGNTLYLDQFNTNGTYVNSMMIPDTGPSALIESGGAPDGNMAAFLSVSANTNFLNVCGFATARPHNSSTNDLGANSTARGIAAISASGFYTLCVSNGGLYSSGTQIRSAVSTDGLYNFWTTGGGPPYTGNPGIKYINPTNQSQGIIAVVNGPDTRAITIFGGNLYYTVGSDVGSNYPGLDQVIGLPTAVLGVSNVLAQEQQSTPLLSPEDLAISPDGLTIYIADNTAVGSGGGIQRWDTNNGSGNFSQTYTLGTGTGSTVGASGVTVDFSKFTGGGSAGFGAIVYATTAETSSNRLIQIYDSGSGSLATVLANAGANQLFQGVRFGPASTPASITTAPTNKAVAVTSNAVFNVVATGTAPFTYQWQINGANLTDGASPSGSGAVVSGSTTASLTLADVQLADDATYTILVTAAAGSPASASATLTVQIPVAITVPPTNDSVAYTGTANFSVTATGTQISYQWKFDGVNLSNGASVSGSGATVAGATTSSLTLSDVGFADVGTYSVVVSNLVSSTNNSAVLTESNLPPTITVSLHSLIVSLGTHAAFVAGEAGTPPFTNEWFFQSAPGVSNLVSGATNASLSVANIAATNVGTYTIIVSNAYGGAQASATLSLAASSSLVATNLIVARVGDGSQVLSGATGNTLYLDQLNTNGTYVSTTMIPDSGPNALIVPGAGTDASYESVLTRSTNGAYLNFIGYNVTQPFGGADVTIGSNVRNIGGIDGLGYFSSYTNGGINNGGAHFVRVAKSTDGFINFWTAGAVGSPPAIKYVDTTNSAIANGQNIPGIAGSPNGCRSLTIFNGNVVYSDVSASTIGIYALVGLPVSATASNLMISTGTGSSPNDFAISPDAQTVYIADDRAIASGGGIQRWDTNTAHGGYALSYTLGTGSGSTVGAHGLTADFGSTTTWGTGVVGAVLYATTGETNGNRLISIVDNGSGSSAAALATAGPNQLLRGVRFGPSNAPVVINNSPASSTNYVGDQVAFYVQAGGSQKFYYQWQFNGVNISGATNSALAFTDVQLGNAGSYTVIVSNLVPSSATSAAGVLVVSNFMDTDDLVGWWPLNDGSGTTVLDDSGYGNNGTLNNFPGDNSEWLANGFLNGPALNFANADANNDNVVVVPDNPVLNFTNNLAFTLMVWVNGPYVQGSGATIVDKGDGTAEQYCLAVYSDSRGSNVYSFIVRNAAKTSTLLRSPISPSNVWQHIAVIYNGSTLRLYLNAQLVATTNAPSSLLYTVAPVSIGNRTSTNGMPYSMPFTGQIQDVRLYSFAMEQTELEDAFNYYNTQVAAAPSAQSGGTFQFSATGPQGYGYRVWTSTDVSLTPVTSTWTQIGSGVFGAGPVSITDTNQTTNFFQKYYTITVP